MYIVAIYLMYLVDIYKAAFYKWILRAFYLCAADEDKERERESSSESKSSSTTSPASTQAALNVIQRRRRPKRRSTGVGHVDMEVKNLKT